MARLFVALDLPSAVTQALIAIQPPASPGVRPTKPEQMHATLHFIGDAEVNRVANSLSGVAEPAFSLALQGVGQFRSRDGGATLWVGIADCPGLHKLHKSIANALLSVGFQPETRPFVPHVTLARCKPKHDAGVVAELLRQHADFSWPAVPIAEFRLYSSDLGGSVPIYRCERGYPLV
jgi:2'-5' RNA ligase